MNTIQRTMTIAALAAALAACGSDGGEGPSDGAGGVGGAGAPGGEGGGGGEVAPEVPEGPLCDDPFSPTSGSPVGVWAFERICGEEAVEYTMDRDVPACTTQHGAIRWNLLEGTVTFHTEGRIANDYRYDRDIRYEIPEACLDHLFPDAAGPAEACAAQGDEIASPLSVGGCTWTAEDSRCTCSFHEASGVTGGWDWELDGRGRMTIGPDAWEFSIDGAWMVRTKEGVDGPFLQVLRKRSR